MPAGMLAQAAAGAEPLNWVDVLRHDVVPVASAFVAFVVMEASYARAKRRGDPPARHHSVRRPGLNAPALRDLMRYVAQLVAGGYLLFLAIVGVFYVVLGGESRFFIVQALREGSVLAFGMVLPAFVLLSVVEDRLRRRPIPDR